MDQRQIREIVKITLDEMEKRHMLKDPYTDVLRVVERKLKAYFNNRGDGNGISYALYQLSDDPYIEILYLQYRDGKTLEWIAEYYNKEVRTILRNKKRLINSIYELTEE